jgi:hypothetical protein
MARASFRVKVLAEQRDPLDVDLLAQAVLMLAAERDKPGARNDSAAKDPGPRGAAHLPRQRRHGHRSQS